MTRFAVIVCAGQSTRFLASSGHSLKKQYIEIEGVPLWVKATYPFQGSSCIDKILIVCPSEDVLRVQSQLPTYLLSKVVSVVAGGPQRQDSVYQGLNWIQTHQEPCEYVFIHDGVRPYVTETLIQRLWNERECGAVIPVISITDTLKSIEGEWVRSTIDRSTTVRVQTPQLFSFSRIWEGFQWLKEHSQTVTDEAMILEMMGKPIKTIAGEEDNSKITVPKDLLSSVILSEGSSPEAKNLSVGQGIDVHPFCEGSKIVLGGIEIPYSKSLKGHSDADVLVHALCDSLLGAAGMSDIGTYFPDSDPQYKDISSLLLLEKVVDKIEASGYKINHIDSTVLAEMPKIKPYVQEMKICLAKVMNLSPSHIGIKATTTEKLGFIGREEGIAAMAIATLLRKKNCEYL